MSNVINSTNEFNFNNLTLGTTQGLQGGGYFSRLLFNDESFITQTPKCYTKKGICKTGKKIYSDLRFSMLEKNDSCFIDWLYKVEEKVRDLIYQSRHEWFLEPPTKEDLEYIWNSCIRNFKSDNRLVRTFIQKPKHLNKGPTITIYDENEDIKDLDSITKDSKMITILEILGVKWTSQSAQLDICLRQVMLLEDEPIFTKCLIKTNTTVNNDELQTKENQTIIAKQTEINTNDNESDEDNIIEKENKLENIPTSQNLFLNIKEKNDKVDNDNSNITTITPDLSNNLLENNDDDEEDDSLILESLETDNNDISANQVENIDKEIVNKNENNLEKNDNDLSNNEIKIDLEPLEKREELHEVEINISTIKDSISLKDPNEVYLEIYKEARKRAKQAKKLAIQAYLEAKRIKSVYLLDQFDSESESDEDDLLLSEEE